MIEIFEGRLGGGKSYSATVRMVDQVRRGGIICTNVELKWENIKKYVERKWKLHLEDDQLIKITDEQVLFFHRYTPTGTPDLPVLVVLDEAHLHFNARDYSQTDKNARETLIFLTQSRKVHTDIIFISQSAYNMDKQFMRLVQFIWRFRDLSQWKIPILSIKYPFQQILVCQYDYDGKTLLQRWFHKKDKEIFKLYNTHSLLKPFPRLEGVKTKRDLKKVERKKLNPQQKKTMIKFFIPLAIIAGIIATYVLWGKMKHLGQPDTPKMTQSTTTTTTKPTIAETEKKSFLPSVSQKAYEVYDEEFVAFNSPDHSLHTSGGWYKAGEMSSKGYVLAVSNDRAKVLSPEGKNAWIVTHITPKPVTQSTPVPSSKPSGTIVVARDPMQVWKDDNKSNSASLTEPSSTPQTSILTHGRSTVFVPATPATPIPAPPIK